MAKDQKFNFKHNNIIRGVDGGKTESFNRPNHTDFMDSAELKKQQFTGVRQNEISREWEFWILGEIKTRIPEAEAFPERLKQAHLDLFQLRGESYAGLTDKLPPRQE